MINVKKNQLFESLSKTLNEAVSSKITITVNGENVSSISKLSKEYDLESITEAITPYLKNFNIVSYKTTIQDEDSEVWESVEIKLDNGTNIQAASYLDISIPSERCQFNITIRKDGKITFKSKSRSKFIDSIYVIGLEFSDWLNKIDFKKQI
jgi:hypothetical protein